MQNSKVTSMTETEIQSATAALVRLRRQLTSIVTLTPADRAAARSVTKKAVLATQMRVVVAREHRDGLPPSFDLRAFEREVALLTALGECLAVIAQFHSDIRDTFLAVGTSAVRTSKVAFGHLQVMAESSGDINQALRASKLRTRKAKQADNASAANPPASAPSAAPVPASTPPTAAPMMALPPATEESHDGKTPSKAA